LSKSVANRKEVCFIGRKNYQKRHAAYRGAQMKTTKCMVILIAGLAFGTAHARKSINIDNWPGTGTGPHTGDTITADASHPLFSGSLPNGISSLILAPGLTDPTASYDEFQNPNGPGDMYLWARGVSTANPMSEQIVVLPGNAGSNELTVEFNYDANDASGCAGEVATLTINLTTYRAPTPCVAGGLNANGSPGGFEESLFHFTINNGDAKLQMLPSGWSVVSAPELDSKTTGSALTLLAGGLAVATARRRRGAGNGIA
jgi:hypothetical protein